MSEFWRQTLYPLGILASLAFTARFLHQWIASERSGKSVVTALFWQISLVGNLLLFVHGAIQNQFHLALVQALNALISLRNLDLMRLPKAYLSFKAMMGLLFMGVALTVGLFCLQDWRSGWQLSWFNVPTTGLSLFHSKASPWWHILGSLGLVLHSCRFWVQWWIAEKTGKSELRPAFWWLSLLGALLSGCYFLRIEDWVNLYGPVVGMIPYIRNLMLLTRQKTQTA